MKSFPQRQRFSGYDNFSQEVGPSQSTNESAQGERVLSTGLHDAKGYDYWDEIFEVTGNTPTTAQEV